jgi:uncharacterized membrane protein YphA (DoxX/SURF4 family)
MFQTENCRQSDGTTKGENMEVVVTVLLWLLGLVFLASGGMKAFMPADKLTSNKNLAWIEHTGIQQARIAGFAEVAAAIAFIGAAVGLLPDALAGIAALGIVVIMVLAIVRVHQPRSEPIVPNVVLAVLALVLAIGIFTT